MSDVLNASTKVYHYKLNKLHMRTMKIQKNKNRRLKREKETHVQVQEGPQKGDSLLVSIIANDRKFLIHNKYKKESEN